MKEPDELRDAIAQAKHMRKAPATPRQVRAVMAALYEIFAGERAPRQLVNTVIVWLTGKESVADLNMAQASLIIEWATEDPERARMYAHTIVRRYLRERGQLELELV